MGPRPGDSEKLGGQLLQSTISIFRKTSSQELPEDDVEALKAIIPKNMANHVSLLKQVLSRGAQTLSSEKQKELLEVSLNVVIELLSVFSKLNSVVMTLDFEYGTSLFPKKFEDQNIFWSAVDKLYTEFIKAPPANSQPRVMIIVCRDSREQNVAVQHARRKQTLLRLEGLVGEAISEYVSSYLNLPSGEQNLVPPPLRNFLSQVTDGNPLYIRETIDELKVHNMKFNEGAGGNVKSVEVNDIDKVDVSEWGHTAMVGNTVCKIEALDPLESAVLKMSTCFLGAFTLGDLSASTCPRWASTNLDFLLLFRAIQRLLESNIIEAVQPPEDDLRNSKTDEARHVGAKVHLLQYFQTRGLLFRQVGSAMVLEVQRKTVKRQALMDRALLRELPAKMAVVAAKRKALHIPWYYEVVLRRCSGNLVQLSDNNKAVRI